MNNQILADYCEEKGFISRSKRLRRKSSKILFGEYPDYNRYLGILYCYKFGNGGYGYDLNYGCGYGNGFGYRTSGSGFGYFCGNGWYYRYPLTTQ